METRNLSSVLEIATATHPGMVRSHNEDSIAADGEMGLAVLADGMGGYNAGEVASGIAVALIPAEMRKALAACLTHELNGSEMERLIHDQATRANSTIYRAAQSEPQYSGMGTTLVVALWHDNRITVGHIGDSRLYRLRDDTLEQITRDHSLLQEQIDSGMITKEQARHAPHKNLVTRAVGIDPEVEPEVHTYSVQPGDIYLLCSDGLPDMVADEDIENTLASLKANLPLAAEQLVQQANDNGGRDNVSVILVRVLRDFSARNGWLTKLKSWF
ncbi:MAG TPA: Stp1/IreP family PP2C-type Ser/Thr phosphatase, partial [Burkholderiales bacterium]|nr:Stp1/IreP family PP2C-type Ser/Thr phosphatase [Burkholderiales bacterium]